jgi:hypothetical protein
VLRLSSDLKIIQVILMKNSTIYGVSLILGSLGLIITMLFHPTGEDLRSTGEGTVHMIQIAVYTHALAIGSIPVGFLGFWGLSRFLGADRPTVHGALILQGFSGIAGLCAAVCSGFGATSLAKQTMRTDDALAKQFLQTIYQYNGMINQGFAKVMLVALTVALMMWSACLLRSKGFGRILGIGGMLIGSVGLIAFLLGVLRLDVLGFGLFVFANSSWTLAVGIWMIRIENVDH